jgi:hypothetical protein
MDIVQTGACVDGVWTSTPSEWAGAISGFAGAQSFSGQISLEQTGNEGAKCVGVGTVIGEVGQTTIKWTVDSFSADCVARFPQSMVITLRRP